MKRWILRLTGGLLLAAGIIVVLAWITIRSSLPELDGSLEVPGLASHATIERDAHGIPTITAASRADLAYATGFAHGQDRYFQMDLIRRQAAGELSELFGSLTVNADKRYRWHRFRSRAQAALTDLTADELAVGHAARAWSTDSSPRPRLKGPLLRRPAPLVTRIRNAGIFGIPKKQ